MQSVCTMIDCAVCLQVMKPPIKVLSCGHSFCLRCVRHMRRQSLMSFGQKYNKMNCPTCRHETLIPRGRTSMLPNNYALHDVLELQKRTTTEDNKENTSPEETKDEINESASPSSETSSISLLTTWTMDETTAGNGTEAWWDDFALDEDEESDVDDNWFCPNAFCRYYNYSFRQVCRYCQTPRVNNSENFHNQPNSIQDVFTMLNSGQLNSVSNNIVDL